MNFLKSAKHKINLRRIFRISLFWGVAGALDATFTNLVGQTVYFQATERYDFTNYLLGNTISYLLFGFISGWILVYWLRDKFRRLPFLLKMLINSVVIASLVVALALIIYHIFFAWIENKSIFSEEVHFFAMEMFFSPFHVKNAAFALLMTIATLFLLNVSDKYGPGVLFGYFLGKYHQPIQEERIFMFVDMKSSTTIAEQIGHIAFHNLLDDFFRDITQPILYTKGLIYQYVGDEVVVTWTMKEGLENYNCVRCFYAMQEALLKQAEKYRWRYGLFPEFKAGLHCGTVTTGEIGRVKRDIVYSGDVLNTTARIQSKCNDFGVKVLLSKRILDKLSLPPHGMQPKKIGDIDLRGKREKVILYSFEE